MFLFVGCENSSSPTATEMPSQQVPDYEQIIRQYNNVLQQNPQNTEALIGLGNTQMDAELYNEAIDSYNKALEITPENVNVRVDMGICYRRTGHPEMAIEAFKKGLTYQPNHHNALVNTGVVLAYDMNDPEGALAAWNKFLAISPESPATDRIRQEIARLNAMKVAQ